MDRDQLARCKVKRLSCSHAERMSSKLELLSCDCSEL